jgi:hypothetical protein
MSAEGPPKLNVPAPEPAKTISSFDVTATRRGLGVPGIPPTPSVPPKVFAHG